MQKTAHEKRNTTAGAGSVWNGRISSLLMAGRADVREIRCPSREEYGGLPMAPRDAEGERARREWMIGRRGVAICREGVYYLFVLAFIVGGATLRDINLLFILAGMMVGPLLFNWRFVAQSLRQLSISRRLPEQVFAGRPFRVEICGQNHRRRLGSWMIVVDDCVQPETSDPEEGKRRGKPNASVVLPHVAAGGMGAAAYQVTLPQRGRYRFGPLWVSTRFPMGLVKATEKLKQFERVIVWPRLGRLTPHWLGLLDARRLGRQASQFRQGPIDGDYYGLREWRPGDSKRWIHWRTTAKLGKLAVRQFEEQQNQDLALVLDLWLPSAPRDEDRGRVEVAVSFGATLVDELARRGGSRLTIGLAARQRGHWTAAASPLFAQQTLQRLALVDAAPENHLTEVLGEIVSGNPLGTQVVVISTRSSQLHSIGRSASFADRHRHQRALGNVIWLDVGSDEVRRVLRRPVGPGAAEFAAALVGRICRRHICGFHRHAELVSLEPIRRQSRGPLGPVLFAQRLLSI